MEWTFLGAATIQMKPNWEKSVWTHQGQIVNDQLTAVYDKVTSSVDVAQAVDLLNFTMAFYIGFL